MKHLKTIFACLLMAVLSIGQVWGADAAVDDVLWSENFAHFGTSTPSTAGTGTGTSTWGSATVTYSQDDNGTKAYDATLAGGTSPELLLKQSNKTWTISGIPTGGATKMALSFLSNKTTFAVTTTTEHLTISGSQKSWTITVDEGEDTPETFNLTIKNTGSSNARLDNVSLVVVTAAAGGGSTKTTITDEQLAWSAASANITYGDEPYSLPSLTNSIPVSVTYQSTDETVATISNVGVVSVLKAGSTTIKAVFAGNDDYNAKTVSYTLTVAPAPLTPIAGGIVDEIKISDLLTSGSGYQPFSDKQASNEGHSDAVYAGKVCISSTNIQMNTIGTNTSAGRSIVTTTSGGNAKRVQAFWGGSNTADRKLTVYGSNTAYAGTETAASGTKLGDLTYASGDSYAYIDITGDYAYLQIVASGAIYMSQINITWVAPDVSKVATPQISGTANFYPSTSVSITCGTENAAIYYTTNGTTPTSASTPYEGAFTVNADGTTTVKAIAVKDGMTDSDVAEQTFTKATVLTVAEALAALDSENPINNVAVSGIISTAPTANPSSGKLTYFISDDGSASDELEVYKGFGVAGASFSDKTDLQVGDQVTVFGNLTIFNTTKEFAEGNRLLAFNRPEVAVTGIDLTESTAEVEVGKTVTLHASVVPANATNKTIVWSVQSGDTYASVDENGIVTGIAAGEAVIRAASDEDATLFAECTVTVTEPAPLSPWATTYTSNVAMAHTGSGVDNGTITIGTDDPYLLVKAGASSSTGTIVVTVPKGTTDLHFHAFAWGGKTAKIELAGVENASVSEFDLAGEAGASGSGNDFTLQGDPVDQYFHVSFDAVAAETEITFSKATGSADNRFFFYGVNQEGGLILESISVSGTATALEYNEGDHFSPAGLGVTGHYSDASTAPITEGIVWAFDPDPLTQGTTSVSVTATAGGFTSAAFVVEGLTVAGAAPLSPWASVYTSNVEIASNTAAHVTINEENFDAAKTSKGASATITLPQGVTTIHLHLVAWKDEAQTVSVTGDCFNEAKELTIVANDGVSGSGTTYALGESGVDYYFSLTPDKEVAANTVITITAASGKRFVLFGVNQEGGVLPVLESIEISGDLSTKTGYKVGDALNLDGLTVEATYSIGGVAQTPVDITDKLGDGLTLTYDPLVENQTEVTITATYGDKSDDITITGLDPVASADPKIYVSTLNVDFGSVEVGEAVPANETVTVTLTNVAAATATLDGEGFSISPSTLTASGDITVSVVASTASAANYSATLTISDDATENPADSKVITLSFAVTEPVVNEEYELVSDVNTLAAGDQIIIVAENAGTYYTLDGSITSQYFPSTAVSISAGIITAPSTSAIILGKDEDNWTMSMGGQLIGATAAKKASLGNNDASNTWTIAIAENVATITNTTTTYGSLQFNYNNGSNSRFLNYTSTQTAVAIYKKVAPEPPTPATPDYTRDVTNGHYGTICLPKAGTIEGATLYEIGSFESNMIYVDEVGTTLAAGVPYIFYASEAQLSVYYTDKTADDVPAGNANGLFGFYNLNDEGATFDISEDAGNYILYNDQYWLVSGRAAYIANYRAYIKISSIVPKAAAPGRRRVAMAVNGTQTATGIEDLNASEKPMKMMINGQIFILRGEKMYDTTGRLVK